MSETRNLLNSDDEHTSNSENDLATANRQTKDDRLLEDHLHSSGFGFFHVIMFLVTGLATAADAVEIFGVSFALPIAASDLSLSTADKGWLDASIFMGMLVGGYLWGSLADALRRKVTLMTAMLLNGVSGFVSAFSPNFLFFLTFRFISGIGVGGSQPVVFSYVSEFYTEKQRGPMIALLAGCWQPGIIFTAFLAWGMLGTEGLHSEISFYIGSVHFVPWRLFLIICTLPAFVSSLSLLVLPETPAFLFHVGKTKQLKKVLNQIHKVNMLCPCCLTQKKESTTSSLLGDEENSLILSGRSDSHTCKELGKKSLVEQNKTTSTRNTHKATKKGNSCLRSISEKLKKIRQATIGIFRWNYLRATVLLLVIWFTLSFGYYGLQLWFPEYFKRLQPGSCAENGTSYEMVNCTNDTDLQFYQDTLYTAIASLPGNIAGVILINIIGARILLAGAMVLSTLSVFSIWRVPHIHVAAVAVSCVFSAVTVTVFASLDVVVMNTYSVELRSTAFGIQAGIGRVGAILGNVMFGHLLDVNLSIPILIVASFLAAGALAALFLPPVYRPENRPPLLRCLYQLRQKFCSCCPKERKFSIAQQQTTQTGVDSNDADMETTVLTNSNCTSFEPDK